MNIQLIRESIEYLDAAIRQLHQDEAGELRTLTPEEQTRFDEGLAMRQDLQRQLERHELVERTATTRPGAARSGDGAATGPAFIDRTGDPFDLSEVRFVGRPARELGRELRDRALRAMDATDFNDDAHRASAEKLVRGKDTRDGALAAHVLVTGSEAYRDAFSKVSVGDHGSLTVDERQALELHRAMSLTNANGGFAIPFHLDPTIILTNAGTINHVRERATVKQTVVKTWHGVTSAGVTAAFAAEATEVADNSPTLAQPAISAHKAHAFVAGSDEVFEDMANLSGDVTMLIADAKDRLEATKFTLGAGDGSNEPNGVVTALAAVGGSVVASITADTFALADVYALQAALPARHRPRASWMAQLAIANKIRQFDTAGGAALWTQLANGTPDILLGKPFDEAEDMDGVINAGATNRVLVYADLSKYYVIDRIGMSIQFIPFLMGANGRPSGQVGWYAHWRVGGDFVDANAGRLLDVT